MKGGTWPPTALRTTRLTTPFKARPTAGAWPLLLWLLALLFIAWPAPADAKPVPVPALTSRVIDQTKTLTPEETDALRGDIVALENQTQAQVAVLMVQTTGGEPIEQYATRVFAQWKLGRQDADDGVLVLVAKKDRRMRIEVGRGLEGTVTDIQAAAIIDREMAPRFRDNDFGGGVQAAVRSLAVLLAGPAPVADTDAQPSQVLSDTAPAPAPRGAHVTPEGWALFGVLLWSLGVGAWYGRGMAGNALERRAVQQSGRKLQGKLKGKLMGKGKVRNPRPEPWADAVAAIEPATPRRKPDWRLVLGLLGVGPVAAAAALLAPAMAGFMAIPAMVFCGIGYAAGRSREVSYVLGGIALVIAALVAVAFAVGQERFWWGMLWALGVGGVVLLAVVIVLCMRNTWQRGVVGFTVRLAVVVGVVVFVFSVSEPGPQPGLSWLPVLIAGFVSLLFAFLPYGAGGGGGSDSDDSGWSSSSSSSSSSSDSSSSSSSDSGGSSSGGGASGSW
jgi:uncharacterized protein